ncbi:hypothetical protein SLEP1_g9912 [Rubroshorea leprosula]|uniref:Uncharacterized protein n=1 Tax=Rubroshorea leprosula TaxID=152421 RepID=A0AAV5IC50_9ROSI|nr:hypothetical protein SLEP1_g9912 [Rubroshorea leprosula]
MVTQSPPMASLPIQPPVSEEFLNKTTMIQSLQATFTAGEIPGTMNCQGSIQRGFLHLMNKF